MLLHSMACITSKLLNLRTVLWYAINDYELFVSFVVPYFMIVFFEDLAYKEANSSHRYNNSILGKTFKKHPIEIYFVFFEI